MKNTKVELLVDLNFIHSSLAEHKIGRRYLSREVSVLMRKKDTLPKITSPLSILKAIIGRRNCNPEIFERKNQYTRIQ